MSSLLKKKPVFFARSAPLKVLVFCVASKCFKSGCTYIHSTELTSFFLTRSFYVTCLSHTGNGTDLVYIYIIYAQYLWYCGKLGANLLTLFSLV